MEARIKMNTRVRLNIYFVKKNVEVIYAKVTRSQYRNGNPFIKEFCSLWLKFVQTKKELEGW